METGPERVIGQKDAGTERYSEKEITKNNGNETNCRMNRKKSNLSYRNEIMKET